jgi:transposase
MSESNSNSSSSASVSSSTPPRDARALRDDAMHYVGLDVHQKQSSLCILDSHGKIVKRHEIKGHWPALLQAVAQETPRPFAVCYEASCGYGYLHDKLAPLADHITVAHPGQLALIYRSKKKNDKVDATKLAKLLYLDMVPQVHVPKADVRAWRALITYRHKLIGKRVAVKNQLRALLRGLGIAAPAGKRLWSGKGQQWLKAQELGEYDALRRDIAIDELADVSKKIRRVEKELNRRADAHPGVMLLQTIPGVGRRTAEAAVAWIDDVSRFSRNKKIGSYFGLVPCQDSSAATNRLGHITKDGPAAIRKLLCEAAWQGIRKSDLLKAFFERVMRGDADRKKIALVATAHHLAKVMGAMLRSGEVWHEPKPKATATTPATKTATAAIQPDQKGEQTNPSIKKTVIRKKTKRKDGCAGGDSASPPRKTA